MNDFIPFIKAVGRGEKLKRDLTYEEAREATRLMLNGGATEAQIGAFLITQRVKGESVDELRGIADEVNASFLQPIPHSVDGLLDLATPWDGKAKTAQLAPSVALTLRAAGVPVFLAGAKHIPTKQGVTVGAVLGALGVLVDGSPEAIGRNLDTHRFAYADASQIIPAWDALTPIRNQFGLRTVCNTIEKLFNPAKADYQISGFFHGNYIKRIRSTQSGIKRSFMVQGEEGSIEIAAGKRTPIFAPTEADDVTIDTSPYSPAERVRIEMPMERDAHVALNRSVIAGEPSLAAQQVAITAGAILYLLEKVDSAESGTEQAQSLLTSGTVQTTLNQLTETV